MPEQTPEQNVKNIADGSEKVAGNVPLFPPDKTMPRAVFILAVTVILLASTIIQGLELSKPWVGHLECDGTRFGIGARNLATRGFLTHAFGHSMATGNATPEEYDYYLNHPLLVTNVYGLAAWIFGASDVTIKIVSILFTVAGLTVFTLFARMLMSRRFALIALVFLAFQPLVLYFGHIPGYLTPTFLFLGLTLVALTAWSRQEKKLHFWSLMAVIFLGCMTDWAYYLFLPFIGIAFAWWNLKNRPLRKKALFFLLPPVVAISIITIHIIILQGGGVSGFFAHLSDLNARANDSAGTWGVPFSVGLMLAKLRVRMPGFITYIPLLLTVIWLVLMGRDFHRRRFFPHLWILALFAGSTVYILIFRGHALHHSYWIFHFGPAVALAAAFTLEALAIKLKRPIAFWCVGAILLALFVAQGIGNTFKIANWVDNADAYDTLALGKALNIHTKPDARIALTHAPSNMVCRWYADRFLARYSSNAKESLEEFTRRRKLSHAVVVPESILKQADREWLKTLEPGFQFARGTLYIIPRSANGG